MKTTNTPLPDYENPPVMEVALSIQFNTLHELRVPHIGLLWQKYVTKRDLVKVIEQPPIKQQFELFGNEQLSHRMEISKVLPIPRCWFMKADDTELVQIQDDRFVHNWKRNSFEDSYPKYENIRTDFLADLDIFKGFLEEQGIAKLEVNQCEVTYVNKIPLSDLSSQIVSINEILAVGNLSHSDDFLPNPESANMSFSYIILDKNLPIGRLHISCKTILEKEDHFLLVTLVARGKPISSSEEGVMEFLDIGHEWIVRGFTSFTSSKIHSIWGKKQ